MEVQYAQIPDASPGFGTPYRWVTTEQIGGDVKYGVDGPVTDNSGETVTQRLDAQRSITEVLRPATDRP